MRPNPGYLPCDTDTHVNIRFVGGYLRKDVKAGKYRWSRTKHDFDIAEWEPAK